MRKYRKNNEKKIDSSQKTYYFYKISCKDSSLSSCYIGKTVNFQRRVIDHKMCVKYNYDSLLYKYIIKNGGIDNFKFEIIDKLLLHYEESKQKELDLMKEFNSDLNKIKYYSSLVQV